MTCKPSNKAAAEEVLAAGGLWRSLVSDRNLTADACTLAKFTTARKWDDRKIKDFSSPVQAYAENMHQKIVQRYGTLAPHKLASILGVQMAPQPDSEALRQCLNFAEYDSELKTIFVNEDSIQRVTRFIAENGLETQMPTSFKEVVIAHELFHFLEQGNREWPGLCLPAQYLRRYPMRHVDSVMRAMASEVAAVHFSKLLTGITFSPCVFEQLLVKLTRNEVYAK